MIFKLDKLKIAIELRPIWRVEGFHDKRKYALMFAKFMIARGEYYG